MSLEQLKREALTSDEQIEIMWDKLDSDIRYRKDFEQSLQLVVNSVQGLEYIYKHLTSGNRVDLPDEPTTLTNEEVAEAIEAVEDELFAAYQMVDVWDRYRAVNQVINNI